MRQQVIAAVLIGGTVVSIALAGCSNTKSPHASTSSAPSRVSSAAPVPGSPVAPVPTAASPTTTTSAVPTQGEGTAIVTIDGKRKEYTGLVTCTHTEDGNVSVVLSKPTVTYSIAVSVSDDGSAVRSVGLGNVDGLSLSYAEYQNGIHASVVRDGNTYTVTGTAVGYNNDKLGETFTKDFEVTVTCP